MCLIRNRFCYYYDSFCFQTFMLSVLQFILGSFSFYFHREQLLAYQTTKCNFGLADETASCYKYNGICVKEVFKDKQNNTFGPLTQIN